MTRDAKGRFRAGESGNVKGRPPGRGLSQELRRALQGAAPSILKAMIAKAIAGDVLAARVVLARAMPELKPTEEAVTLDLDGQTLADRGRAVLDAVADGRIAPSQAESLLSALAALAKIIETTELQERIESLERATERMRG